MILDTPDISPLGHVLRLISAQEEVSAVFLLRNRDNGELSSVTVVEINDHEHERERGAIFFGGTLDDGRRIRGFVFATPQGEDPEVLGSATIE
ncbi:MAG TPA: hypothetical protein VJM46_02390 [Candidatus Saccharimonadales bacterium]|nr:hypothetical protein [Candidatus Saccharimonadales bacterium]